MFLKDASPLILYDVECGMSMEPIQGKCASSQVHLRYPELFCVPEVTSVFFSSCCSVLGDSLEFHQAKRGSLLVCLGRWNCSSSKHGNWASSHGEWELSCVFASCGLNLGYILELRRGWQFETRVCSSKSGLLSTYDGHLRNLN